MKHIADPAHPSPVSPGSPANHTPIAARYAALLCLLCLIGLGLAWELKLAPLRPGGSWLALKVLPLIAALHGVLHGRRYTFQWMSLLIWLYFTEGIVRATSEHGLSATLGWIETGLSIVLFCACAVFARVTRPPAQAG